MHRGILIRLKIIKYSLHILNNNAHIFSAGDRSSSPLQFPTNAGFASYCRNLWGAPLLSGGPRYLAGVGGHISPNVETNNEKNNIG